MADTAVRNFAELAARVLLSALFLYSGFGKVTAYAGTAAYMAAKGVPGTLLPLVIATEILGAAAIIVGWKTRIAAFLLAGYTLLTAVLFHNNFADPGETINFLKNLGIAGGFLLLVAHGAGRLSVDGRVSG